jgi:probable rRNA maturation factor
VPAHIVQIQIDEEYAGEVKPSLVRAAARSALRHEAAPELAQLTIAVTGDVALRALNKRFLGIDAPTDVLSFPFDDTPPALGFQGKVYLGDIAISLPRAQAQAQVAGHSVDAELRLLTVHGVLHLLGHDHSAEAGKVKMWAAQEDILRELGEIRETRELRRHTFL